MARCELLELNFLLVKETVWDATPDLALEECDHL